MYQLNETFFSLKGEGIWTGYPMYFIRFSGCNIGCPFCDTDYAQRLSVDDTFILREVNLYKAQRVVITGGEPMMHEKEVYHLVNYLHYLGLFIHLETNGTIATNVYGEFDWIALSPKRGEIKLAPKALNFADEVKIPWDGGEYGADFVEEMVAKTPNAKYRYLLPITKSLKEGDRTRSDFINTRVESAINFILSRTELKLMLCHQLHKCLNFK